jgi:hypothetical protein
MGNAPTNYSFSWQPRLPSGPPRLPTPSPFELLRATTHEFFRNLRWPVGLLIAGTAGIFAGPYAHATSALNLWIAGLLITFGGKAMVRAMRGWKAEHRHRVLRTIHDFSKFVNGVHFPILLQDLYMAAESGKLPSRKLRDICRHDALLAFSDLDRTLTHRSPWKQNKILSQYWGELLTANLASDALASAESAIESSFSSLREEPLCRLQTCSTQSEDAFLVDYLGRLYLVARLGLDRLRRDAADRNKQHALREKEVALQEAKSKADQIERIRNAASRQVALLLAELRAESDGLKIIKHDSENVEPKMIHAAMQLEGWIGRLEAEIKNLERMLSDATLAEEPALRQIPTKLDGIRATRQEVRDRIVQLIGLHVDEASREDTIPECDDFDEALLAIVEEISKQRAGVLDHFWPTIKYDGTHHHATIRLFYYGVNGPNSPKWQNVLVELQIDSLSGGYIGLRLALYIPFGIDGDPASYKIETSTIYRRPTSEVVATFTLTSRRVTTDSSADESFSQTSARDARSTRNYSGAEQYREQSNSLAQQSNNWASLSENRATSGNKSSSGNETGSEAATESSSGERTSQSQEQSMELQGQITLTSMGIDYTDSDALFRQWKSIPQNQESREAFKRISQWIPTLADKAKRVIQESKRDRKAREQKTPADLLEERDHKDTRLCQFRKKLGRFILVEDNYNGWPRALVPYNFYASPIPLPQQKQRLQEAAEEHLLTDRSASAE